MTATVEVLALDDLRLQNGTCDVCKTEGWVILVIIEREKPIAFYVCDRHRRELIERLAIV